MNWIVLFSAIGLTIAILLALPIAARAFGTAWMSCQTIARRKFLAEVLVFIFAFALAAIPTIRWGAPLPMESDEFSYLLQADTFAHGRLTNPPSPMADMLETAEVIQSPTYSSKYPPGQGLFLAIGQELGLPIAGAWLSGALACAAITWMLRGFFATDDARFAFLGGLLAALHPLMATWNNSYWGGSVATLGAALLIGGAMRSVGLVTGLGLSILAISRPFEGALVGIILFAFQGRAMLRTLPSIALGLAPGLLFLGYFNYRVTGNPFLFPHLLHARQYLIVPRFFWESPRSGIVFHSRIMHDFAMIEMSEYQQHLGVMNFLKMFALKLGRQIMQYDFPPTLLIASIIGALCAKKTRAMFAIVAGLLVLHLSMIPITRPAYFAPMFPALFVLIVAGVRRMRWEGIVAAMLAAQVVAFVQYLPVVNAIAHTKIAQSYADDLARLRALPGKQLVLVRYAPGKLPGLDFVTNEADIENSKVVFARSIDEAHDRALLEHFHGRQLWLITADDLGYRLEPLR